MAYYSCISNKVVLLLWEHTTTQDILPVLDKVIPGGYRRGYLLPPLKKLEVRSAYERRS